MISGTFTRDPVGWYGFTQAPNGAIQTDMRNRAMRLRRYARAQVGVDSHRLQRSIDVTLKMGPSGTEWWVGSNVRYALAHHQGTKPHYIYPDRARVLRFSSRGKIVYAARVLHPGTKPNRYLTDNLRRVVN